MYVDNMRWAYAFTGAGTGISSAQRSVLVALAFQASSEGVCRTKGSILATMTCLCERAVRSALRDLESLLAVQRVEGSGGPFRYRLMVRKPAADAAIDRQQMPVRSTKTGSKCRVKIATPAADAAQTSLTGARAGTSFPISKNIKENTNCGKGTSHVERGAGENLLFPNLEKKSPDKIIPSPKERMAAIATDFEAFWAAYPRKVAKPKAKQAYERARIKTDHETIMRGLLGAVFTSDPTYQPHPTSWLNGERWSDLPPPPRPAPEQNQSKWHAKPDKVRWSAMNGVDPLDQFIKDEN